MSAIDMIRALLALLLALAVIAVAQTWRLSRWQDRAATAEAQVAGYAEAAPIRAEAAFPAAPAAGTVSISVG